MNLRKWLRERRLRRRLARLAEIPCPEDEKRWVFVVGCYNSGTTLLHDILASHPRVAHLPQEGQYCTDQLPVPSRLGLPRAWALAPERFIPKPGHEPDAERLRRQWCGMMSDPRRPIFLEKSIPNAARIRWLAQQFPGARFLALMRNGYAVAEGIRRKAGHPLELAARQWRVSNQIMLEQLSQVEHGLLLRYEELTGDPGATLGRVLEFLELDPAHLTLEREWTVHGITSGIRDMNPVSLARLSETERDIIRAEAEELLDRFQYEGQA